MRLPHETTAGFSWCGAAADAQLQREQVVTHAQVQLQREALFVCDVCGFFFFVC